MTDAERGRQDDDRDLLLRPGELPPSRRPPSRQNALVDRLAAAPEVCPALVAVGIFLFWATAQGGVISTDAYPGALILLGLLVVTGVGFRDQLLQLPRPPLLALTLLAGFTFWSFCSIVWADDQGAAWDGANRCLTYLIVFSVFVIPAWRPRAAAGVLGVYAIGIGVIAAVILLKAAGSADPLEFLIAGRFSEPTGYHNANAAVFTGAMLIAIFIASRSETPWPLRGVMLALAGVLLQLALIPQSRGWLIAVPVALIAYLLLVPGMARSLTAIVPLAVVTAPAVPSVLDVYDVVNRGDPLAPALDEARTTMLVAAAALFVIGSAIGLAEGRFRLTDQAARRGTLVANATVGAAAVVGVVVALIAIGNPVSWADDRWDEFKSGEFEHRPDQGSRLAQGLGTNRYDFWRVAADEFTDSPLHGVGSSNFAQDYVRDRESGEEPTHAHNLPLSVLSETGLIGGLLFSGFLAVSSLGIAGTRRRAGDPLARGIAGLVAVCLIYWFIHSVGDWFWAFPALSAPVFAWIALALRVDAERGPFRKPRWARRRRTPLALGAAAAAVVAAGSLVLPWVAALEVEKASETWGTSPTEAFDRLDRARKLNFLSARPDLVQGAIAAQLGVRRRTRASFERALERDPRNWYATIELAALDAIEGDSQSAIRRLDRVAELNPMEPQIEVVRQGVLSGQPVSLRELQFAFLSRYCDRLGRRPGPDGCE